MKKLSRISLVSFLMIICFAFLTACTDINNWFGFDNSDIDNQPKIDNPQDEDDYYKKDAVYQNTQDFGKIVSAATKGSVEILVQSPYNSSTSQGSGFIAAKNKTTNYPVIITNYHVIQLAVGKSQYSILIKLGDKADYFEQTAKIMGYDAQMDIAVLTLEKEIADIDDRILPWGNSRAVFKGQPVFVIGNSLGYGLSYTSGSISVTEELLAAQRNSYGYSSNSEQYLIRHDAAIQSGNSGGALFNLKGEVIGVNSYGYLAEVINNGFSFDKSYYLAANMSLAIPSNLAQAICDYVLANYQGVVVDASRARNGFSDYVKAIKPALDKEDNNVLFATKDIEDLGLKTNEIIVKINDIDVNRMFLDDTQICSPSILIELSYYCANEKSDDQLTITVKRNGEELTIFTGYYLRALPDWLKELPF
ncbi:MAG TPA: trypsin-like peptidase domain-containing protein [Clostridia bacterium]